MLLWLVALGAVLTVLLIHDGASWPIHAAEGAVAGGIGGVAVMISLSLFVWLGDYSVQTRL
jgi:hypothetical protein